MGKSKAKKPTLAQKKIMSAKSLRIENWLVIGETEEELRLVSRATGRTRVVDKRKSATEGPASQTVAHAKKQSHYNK